VFFLCYRTPPFLHSFPPRRSSDLFRFFSLYGRVPLLFSSLLNLRYVSLVMKMVPGSARLLILEATLTLLAQTSYARVFVPITPRSEEHTSELQSREKLVCRLLLEK